ncbi:uncharacterized protein TrAtP1_011530 [Trichoderma atroviride]|uniref:uncharacterized protein n=1 Tax=Hypocrea atroviridis TaxID=63577 RepID=UPI0033266A6C|nr:hypothetical protein TrAtP1_011530 [Trichoderma atroviride]
MDGSEPQALPPDLEDESGSSHKRSFPQLLQQGPGSFSSPSLWSETNLIHAQNQWPGGNLIRQRRGQMRPG